MIFWKELMAACLCKKGVGDKSKLMLFAIVFILMMAGTGRDS